MTQPRKEQINDQRTYYTRVDSVGVTTPIPFGTPDVPGGTVQTIQNVISENYYNEFLSSTVTGTPGGAEADTPAYFYGNSGPFSSPIVPGAAFAITLPGINSGNPVVITLQPSDSVNIGGTPYVTTSKVVGRINAALTVAGVNPSTAVALNVNGQLVLLSANAVGYTSGENAFITVSNVNVGIGQALGFLPPTATSATALGLSSPVRGIVTTVMNGVSAGKPQVGGLVQLILPDASPAITKTPNQINVGGLGNIPLYPAGQSIVGALQQFTDAATSANKFTIQYQRQGAVPAKVITVGGNFSTLTTADTFQVTVVTTNPFLLQGLVPNPGVATYTFTVGFGSNPTGASDVIAAVNTAWNAQAAANGYPVGTEAGRGGIFGLVPGPWQFINGIDQFWILFNGQALSSHAVSISPPTGLMTTADLATFINAAIAASPAVGQGQASVGFNGGIQITSVLTSGPASIVQIFPGDQFNDAPILTNVYTTTLDKLGITSGVYTGSILAKPYGSTTTPEEIQFLCPDHTLSDPYGHGTSIAVNGSASVMAKMGLPLSGLNITVHIGLEPVTPPIVHALIPEMMYFGEVPENIETTADKFLTTDEPAPVLPSTGTGNIGVSPLMGPDGKINPDLLRKVFDVLSLDSLTLGARNLGLLQGNQIPRLVTPFNNSPGHGTFTLLWEGSSISGLTGPNASQIMRFYADWEGGLWLTSNAAQTGAGTPYQWNKDTGGQPATALYIGQSTTAGVPKLELLYTAAATTNPFVFTGEITGTGSPPVAFDPSGAAGGAVAYAQLGQATDVGADNLIPRLQTAVAPNDVTLIWETPPQLVSATTVPGVRFYVTQTRQFPSGVGVVFWLTINAFWNGTAWQKDVNGVEATAFLFNQGSPADQLINILNVYWQNPADNTPWATWGSNPAAGDYKVASINAYLDQVLCGTLVPGDNILQTPAGRAIPRILIGIDNGAVAGLRTLMSQFGISGAAGGGGAQTRIYRGYGLTVSNGLGPGNNDFTIITHNAGWNATTSQWVQDESTIGSTMQSWSNVGGSSPSASSGVTAFYYVPAGSGTFIDAIWSEVGSFTRVGLQTPFTSDPYNSLGVGNLTNNANTVKAWGSFFVIGGATPTILWEPGGSTFGSDSFNVASVTWSSITPTVVTVTLHAGLANPWGCVICSPISEFFGAQEVLGGSLGHYLASGVPNNPFTNQFIFSFTDTITGNAIDLSNPSNFAGCSFVIHGRQ